MEQTDIDRIALAIHALRSDWPANSLRTFISNRETTQGLKLSDMGARRVALALTWVALDPTTRAPTRVLEHGPWWWCEPAAVETAPEPPRFQACPEHTKREPCPDCRAAMPEPARVGSYAAAARAAIRPTNPKMEIPA